MSQFPPEPGPGTRDPGSHPGTTDGPGLPGYGDGAPGAVAPASGTGHSGSAGGSSTGEVAKDEAARTKDTAVEAGRDVVETAKEQTADVAAEVREHASDLTGRLGEEVRTQTRGQQQRLVEGLRSTSTELDEMASGSQQSGIATEVSRQVSQGLGRAAGWLDGREPSDVLEEVRGFARRQPALFLLGAGLAGVVVGRLARGAVAQRTELDSPSGSSGPRAVTQAPSGTGRAPQADPTRAASLVEEDTATPGAASGRPAPGVTADPAARVAEPTGPWIDDDRPDVTR